jgi:hypothetical protein
VRRKFDDTVGWLLLRVAVTLERTVAGEGANQRLVARRNAALRAAYRRGVPVEVLAARTRLTPGWVRQVVNGKKPAPLEEAA